MKGTGKIELGTLNPEDTLLGLTTTKQNRVGRIARPQGWRGFKDAFSCAAPPPKSRKVTLKEILCMESRSCKHEGGKRQIGILPSGYCTVHDPTNPQNMSEVGRARSKKGLGRPGSRVKPSRLGPKWQERERTYGCGSALRRPLRYLFFVPGLLPRRLISVPLLTKSRASAPERSSRTLLRRPSGGVSSMIQA
jgi:hypothetical protein